MRRTPDRPASDSASERKPARTNLRAMEGRAPAKRSQIAGYPTASPEGVRLHKALADMGVASRRHAEEMIRAGRVSVNGEVVRGMGTRVNPAKDRVAVDGQTKQPTREHVYLMLNKPRNVITTVSDPEGRPTVMEYLPKDGSIGRVYPIGRLDFQSEGLVLLTDDGTMANRLMHPRFEHEKEYHVLVEGRPSPQAIESLRHGMDLQEGKTAPAQVEVIEHIDGNTWLRVVLHEGRNRQIRRMVEQIGHRVRELTRVRIGTLRIGDLASGKWRYLTGREISELRTRS